MSTPTPKLKTVYVLSHSGVNVKAPLPAGAKVVTWDQICQRKDWRVLVKYDEFRNTSRWKSTERKRRYIVCGRHLDTLGSYKTLANAVKAAREYG